MEGTGWRSDQVQVYVISVKLLKTNSVELTRRNEVLNGARERILRGEPVVDGYMRVEIAGVATGLGYMLTKNSTVDLAREPLYAVSSPALEFRPTSIKLRAPLLIEAAEVVAAYTYAVRSRCARDAPTRTSMRIQDASHLVHLRLVGCRHLLAGLTSIQGRATITGRLPRFLPPFGFLPILLGHNPFTIYAAGSSRLSGEQQDVTQVGRTPLGRELATTSYHPQHAW